MNRAVSVDKGELDNTFNYEVVDTPEQLQALVDRWRAEKRTCFSVDCEWKGTHHVDGFLRSIQFAWSDKDACYLRFFDETGKTFLPYEDAKRILCSYPSFNSYMIALMRLDILRDDNDHKTAKSIAVMPDAKRDRIDAMMLEKSEQALTRWKLMDPVEIAEREVHARLGRGNRSALEVSSESPYDQNADLLRGRECVEPWIQSFRLRHVGRLCWPDCRTGPCASQAQNPPFGIFQMAAATSGPWRYRRKPFREHGRGLGPRR